MAAPTAVASHLLCTTNTASTAQVKVAVGPVGSPVEQSFLVNRKLGPQSTISVVTLPKPLGIVFELSKAVRRQIFVTELVRNGNADRATRVYKLFEGQQMREKRQGKVIYGGGVNVGDLLLATTMVNVEVDFFGFRAPRRVIMFLAAEGRTWTQMMGAIQSSFVADGPVTLVLERES